MSEIQNKIVPLFSEMETMVSKFKKSTYAGLFDDYRTKHTEYWQELERELSSDNSRNWIEEEIRLILEYGKNRLDQVGIKMKRENLQLTMNMFLAVYYIPAVRKTGTAEAEHYTEELCRAWAEKFKGNPIKSAQFETIQGGFKSKLCYVTTAVCRSMNKPEDCYELNLLKAYRDDYLLKTEKGEELVREYYDIAPTIVKRIEKKENADEAYRQIWEEYLKPCIYFIEQGDNSSCSERYIKMVEELKEQYLVTEKKERA